MTTAAINIQRIDSERVLVPVTGTSPLICHNFGHKARQQMLDGMQGRKTPKQAKNPDAEYEASFYRHTDGSFGFPVTAFKQATVGGARFYGKDVTMTTLRQTVFFHGEHSQQTPMPLVRITGEPKMREDVVRLNGKTPDLRYRPEFLDWATTLDVTYVKSALTLDSLVSLIDAGGLGVGVGEWRPEKGGDFGTYQVDTNAEIEVIG